MLEHQSLVIIHRALGCNAQGVWTDGVLGLSVGLDQRLRTWGLRPEATSSNDAGAEPGDGRGTDGWCTLREGVSSVVQVLEPAALSVVHAGVHVWHVAVAGRGTQLLRLSEGL